jgi:hypothetical protein
MPTSRRRAHPLTLSRRLSWLQLDHMVSVRVPAPITRPEVVRALREFAPRLPVLLLPAADDPNLIKSAHGSGVSAVRIKPNRSA